MNLRTIVRHWREKAARAANSVLSGAETLLLALRRNWFLVWISGWMVAIYAERIAVDTVIRRANMTQADSAISSVCVIFFLTSWLLTLWAFKIEEEDVPHLRAWLGRVLKDYRGNIWSTMIFAGMALYLLGIVFIEGPFLSFHILLGHWFGKLWAEFRDTIVQVLPGLAIVGFLYLFYRIISKLFAKQDLVYRTFREWTLSFIPIVLGLLLYLLAYEFFIFKEIADAKVLREAWKGLFKDSIIYTLCSLVIIQGIYRYRQCCDAFVERYAKWIGFSLFVIGVANIAALAVIFDMKWLEQLASVGSPEYPDPATHNLLRVHVMVRDWVMMVPLLTRMFVWLGGEMCGAWNVIKTKT